MRTIPMMLVMGIIYYLSDQPGDTLCLPDIPGLDKVLHGAIYGVLAVTTLFAIPEQTCRNNRLSFSLLVVLFCFLYGISDEYHQMFVPNRFPSPMDLAADTAGAVVAVCMWRAIESRGQGSKGAGMGLSGKKYGNSAR